MPDPILMCKAFALAAAAGLVITLLLGRWSVVGALAVVAAMFAGVWVLGLLPHFPPTEDLDRLLLTVLPAAAVAEVIAAASAKAGWLARAVVAVGAAPVLLHGTVHVTDLSGPGSREWSPATTWLVFASLGTLLFGTWAAMNRLAVRPGGRTAAWCVGGATLGAGGVIMLSGYASGGQVGVPLAAGLVGVAIASLIRKATPVGVAVGVGVVGLFALLLVGRLFAGLTDLNAALLFAAPLLAWLPEVLPPRPRLRAVLKLALAAGPVVVALVLAQQKFAADSGRPGSPPTEGSLDDYTNFGK